MNAIENLYTPDCIRTVTGKYVNVFDPTPDMICIEDIAHALSQQPRFGGHLPVFFSVAQHSVGCMLNAQPDERLGALMHDASEAYLMDIPSPIKKRLANYDEIENELMAVIAEKFGFAWPLPETIKKIDRRELEWEWHTIMLGGCSICSWWPAKAKYQFLKAFRSI